ncbi:MAG: C40 family peptidase [Rubrivivax sp.]|nr:C40 family peptidase [Rubrivivax sp.]
MTIPKTVVVTLFSLLALAAQAQPSAPAPGGAAQAEADGGGDGLLRLMIDKGLVPLDAAAQAARQVRHAASDLVISTFNYLGVTYRRGGNNAEEGFDCSGFVRYIYQTRLGLVLPRRADEQAQAAGVVPVDRDELKPGDLVFFNTLRRAFSHVGIYVGDGKFIHSPRTGHAVRVEDMNKDYWVNRFNGARRVTALDPSATEASARGTPTR